MKKHYSFFAKWRKQDVEFLNSFKLMKTITEGYDGFWVEEGDVYEEIRKKFTKKNIFLKTNQPPEFNVKMTSVTFSQEELNNADYYMLCGIGEPKGYPLPKNGYEDQTFDFKKFNYIKVNKVQKAPFRIKKPKWKKNQKIFSLNLEWDFIFVKKDFYQEVFASLGLKFIDVIDHSTGKPLEDVVQLDIPLSESKILLENSAYDIYKPRCGTKQYARQYLDFFPSFEKEFNFHICYTREEFDGGHKRIIISKDFCKLLVNHKIIKYDSDHLIPMKSN